MAGGLFELGRAPVAVWQPGHNNKFWLGVADLVFSLARPEMPQPSTSPRYKSRSYAEAKAAPTEVSSILEQRIRGVQEEAGLSETGRVLSVGYVPLIWSGC